MKSKTSEMNVEETNVRQVYFRRKNSWNLEKLIRDSSKISEFRKSVTTPKNISV